MADKKEMKIFTLSEYEEEEQYLNQMARSGYLFEKVTLPGVYHFRKTAPVNMVYRIDFNPKKKEDWDSYKQMYQDYGWTYIQDFNEYSYFCKVAEDEEEANEIFSDNQSRIDMMDRIIRRKMLPIVAIFLCCVIPQAVRMADGMYTDRERSMRWRSKASFNHHQLIFLLNKIYIVVYTNNRKGLIL